MPQLLALFRGRNFSAFVSKADVFVATVVANPRRRKPVPQQCC
jgi:hypothetical protein